ncbi:hypothetical protein ACFXTN_026757 [Malus domestica]
MDDNEVFAYAKKISAPYDLMMQMKHLGRLPVVYFAASGVATPSSDPGRRARAIVQASTNYSDPDVLAEISCGLSEAMIEMNLNDEKVEWFTFRFD